MGKPLFSHSIRPASHACASAPLSMCNVEPMPLRTHKQQCQAALTLLWKALFYCSLPDKPQEHHEACICALNWILVYPEAPKGFLRSGEYTAWCQIPGHRWLWGAGCSCRQRLKPCAWRPLMAAGACIKMPLRWAVPIQEVPPPGYSCRHLPATNGQTKSVM